MAKSKTSTYVLTLKLNTEEFQENILNKRLEISRNISNSLTNVVLKRYNLMLESKEYNKIKNQLKPNDFSRVSFRIIGADDLFKEDWIIIYPN